MVKLVSMKTENVQQIRTLFEVLKDILNETIIEFVRRTDDDKKVEKKIRKIKKINECVSQQSDFSGIRILTVSTDKTVLICLKLYAQKFVEFFCKPASYEIGVNLPTLNKLLKSTDKEDELEMYVDNEDKQSLVLTVNNSSIGKSTEFRLKLRDLDKLVIEWPKVEPDVMITMDVNEFHKLCKEMSFIGQYLDIKCTNSTLILSCSGRDSSRETKYVANENGIKIIFASDKNLIVHGIFELKDIILFTKCASLSGDIQLLMNVRECPLCITYTIATLGEFIVCIQPRILQNKTAYDESDDVIMDDEIVFKSGYNDD